MNDKRFFDTNILFYAYDTSDPGKQSTAEGLIRQAAADASGVVSTQVLGEFFHACAELLTEDFNDGQHYDGVRARNPFRTAAVPEERSWSCVPHRLASLSDSQPCSHDAAYGLPSDWPYPWTGPTPLDRHFRSERPGTYQW